MNELAIHQKNYDERTMHALEEHVTNQWYGVARNNLANIYIYLKEMKDGTGGNHNKNNDNRITDVLATESYTCFD